jgi:hypothetical protein
MCRRIYSLRTLADTETLVRVSLDQRVLITLPDDEDAAYVVYEGTHSVSDMIRHAFACQRRRRSWSGMTIGRHALVHRGWADMCAEMTRSPMLAKAMRQANERRSIYLGGHSYGGALAVLQAVGLKIRGYHIDGVTTIGCPHVGNRTFSDLFRAVMAGPIERGEVNHVRTTGDIVPMVPWLSGLAMPCIIGLYTRTPGTYWTIDTGKLPDVAIGAALRGRMVKKLAADHTIGYWREMSGTSDLAIERYEV